ncbi:MAG: tripartite tricarboxylate transporter substrate binding protein [Polaromonas sp.]|nr:tripartite tricarboxylate transporter substrate binding protein [Polaromonas sp.]
MKMHRRSLAIAAALATLISSVGFSGRSFAQSFPNKPIRLVTAFGNGSVNDLIARDVARYMTDSLGQTVVVDTRVGGGGSIATDIVAKAAPDGYTIGLGTSSQLVMNVGLIKSLPFDVDRDLRSIGLVARTPTVIVASTSMPKTLKEVIAYAKANPGKVTYGSAGTGAVNHIFGAAFARAANVSLLHVPYKGSGPALIDLSGGHVNLLLDSLISTAPIAQQGRAHLLAISTGKRSPAAPDLPTFAELGFPTLEAFTWNNLFAPAKTPDDIIAKLNAALNKALTEQGVKDRLAQGASENLGPSTPAQADAFGVAQRAKWVPFTRALKIDVN